MSSIANYRLASISKRMSGALRRRKLSGMTDEGRVHMQNVLSLRGMLALGASVHDVYDIVAGGGGNNKFRFELSSDRCQIRCAQCHSVGSGVHHDCLPIATDVKYLAHGASLESARQLTQNGLSRCQRMHIHFYECDQEGYVMDGRNVRCGSEVAIAISARQCMGDGVAFYRSANNVALSEGANGVIGGQYFRFIYRLHRGPNRKSCILRHREGWIDRRMTRKGMATRRRCSRVRMWIAKRILHRLQPKCKMNYPRHRRWKTSRV